MKPWEPAGKESEVIPCFYSRGEKKEGVLCGKAVGGGGSFKGCLRHDIRVKKYTGGGGASFCGKGGGGDRRSCRPDKKLLQRGGGMGDKLARGKGKRHKGRWTHFSTKPGLKAVAVGKRGEREDFEERKRKAACPGGGKKKPLLV